MRFTTARLPRRGLCFLRHSKPCLEVFLAVSVGFTTLGKDVAPPSPNQSWYPPGMDRYVEELTNKDLYAIPNTESVSIDPDKAYDLPELIDIAERSNPDTRIAWEHARQAAQAVGLSLSAYYPYLAASAAGSYNRELGAINTVFPATVEEEATTLDLKWLLFDFGARKAATTSAREQLMLANVSFNATHQQIVFNVTQRFYQYITAREKVEVAESALQAAQTVDQAAQARFDNGLTTKPIVLQAEQQTAQADYDLEAARGDLSDALVALEQSLGIVPNTQLQVAKAEDKPFAENVDETLDDLIYRGLSQRPDLMAELANVHAREADVRKARAAYYPKISLDASGGWSKVDINAYQSPFVGNSKPGYGVGVHIELPIFDGFVRASNLRIAKSQLREADSALANSRNAVIRDVWQADTDLKTALRKQESATKLVAAAQSAFDASLEAYRNGLGTYVDTANAQRDLTAAQGVVVDTRSGIFTSAAALALSVGDLAKPSSSPKFVPKQP
jgi:outer membrane protein